ncbi:MAG TPA: hypothetical protein VIY28_20550 [Pseudonocardiaceae bacterium]
MSAGDPTVPGTTGTTGAGQQRVSMAMKKSPLVARSESSLVAS